MAKKTKPEPFAAFMAQVMKPVKEPQTLAECNDTEKLAGRFEAGKRRGPADVFEGGRTCQS